MKKIFFEKLKDSDDKPEIVYTPNLRELQKRYIRKTSNETSFMKKKEEKNNDNPPINSSVYTNIKFTPDKKINNLRSPARSVIEIENKTSNLEINSADKSDHSFTLTLLDKPAKKIPRFPFEDFILIEEKIVLIIKNLKSDMKTIINNFIEWWNCYTVSFFFSNNFPFDFSMEIKTVLKSTSKLLMYSIILSYYYILLQGPTEIDHIEVLEIMLYHHRIYLLMSEIYIKQIQQKIKSWYKTISQNESEILKKMQKQIQFYINRRNSRNSEDSEEVEEAENNKSKRTHNLLVSHENITFKDLKLYCKNLKEAIANNLEQLKQEENKNSKIEIFDLYDNLENTDNLEIHYFFCDNFFNAKITMDNSLKYLREVNKMGKISVPFLTANNPKKYTLVLDLDETLIHFVQDKTEKGIKKGVLQFRPGLYEFLENISPYYELIVFTVGTKVYADSIINTIEKEKKYFSYRFYREHATIFQKDFIKDLSKIGRDLSKVIIIDDKPSNFCMQKENGIMIKPFWGSDSNTKVDGNSTENENNDFVLLNLIPILIDIAKDKSQDVRVGISKNKFTIITHVSTWLFKKEDEF